VTAVPLNGIGAFRICIQYVSPLDASDWCSSIWPDPGTLATALSQSFPTPSTIELLRVVVSEAVGAPEAAFPVPVLPTAPEPFVPEVSTPATLATRRDETTFCERVAVTDALLIGLGAKARQISDVPICVFVRLTRAHVNPAPVTLVTVMFAAEASVAIIAKINSFPTVVDKVPLVTLVEEFVASVAMSASIATVPAGGGSTALTVRVALLVATKVPEMVTVVNKFTAEVVTVKLALNCPAGTVTEPGTLATDELLLESATTTPPLAAGWPKVTVPWTGFPPVTFAVLRVKEVKVWAVVVAATVIPGDGTSRFALSSVARVRIV
jgi:hypothetical protein